MFSGPKIITDGLVLSLDAANTKSFRGEPTTNTTIFPNAGASRYNNPGFSGNVINTGQIFMGSPIWEVTFIPQDSGRIPILGSTDGFGFLHSMGIPLLADTDYMGSVYFKTSYPLVNTSTQGFNNTYSNISGWGSIGTANTRYQEGEWTRLYTMYRNSLSINSINYSNRGNSNILSATVNTTTTTQILVSITVQANGTFQTVTDFGSNTLGGGLTSFNFMEGIYFASPTITSAGGIVGLSTGTSNILQHGLDTTTWTKLSATNNIVKSNFPFTYYLLLNVPSTEGVNATIQFRLNLTGFYTALSDNKFWKVTFDTTNLQVNDVIRTYWAAPMIEQHNRTLPSKFVIGTRGTTVATGGGWADRSGNGNEGELVNGVGYNSSNGGSLVFDGVDDYVTIPNILMGNGNIAWTVNVWIKTITTVNSLGQGSIISNSSGGPVYSMLGINNSKIVYWTYQNNAWSKKLGNKIINDNNWHMLTWVNYINSTMDMYVDGLIDFNVLNSTSGNNNPLNIIGGSWAGRYVGNISGIKINLNKSFTAQEVFQNYNATKSRYGL